MEEFEICFGCVGSDPCVKGLGDGCDHAEWLHCRQVKEEPPKEPELEFGQAVEVLWDNRWQPAKFAGVNNGGRKHFFCNGKVYNVPEHTKYRLPLEDRIRKGQPIWAGGELVFFKRWYAISAIKSFSGSTYETWKLPTQQELDEIGQGDFSWLTEES
jgi:hypothetical protein